MGTKRSRFIRPPKDRLAPLSLNQSPRYDRILTHLWQHRFLTTPMLGMLLLADEKTGTLKFAEKLPKSPDGVASLPKVQVNLRKLWQHSYIEKWLMRDNLSPTARVTQTAYALTPKGAQRIAELHGLLLDEVKFPQKPDPGKPHGGSPVTEQSTLKHQLLISETLAAIALACACSEAYRLVFMASDKAVELRYSRLGDGRAKEHFIKPDGVLILEERATGRRKNFFLEADRSTEKTTTFKNKLAAYFQLPKTTVELAGKPESYYSFFPDFYKTKAITPEAAPQLQWFQNVRVLTVTRNEIRCRNLLSITRQAFREGKGSNMFYYAALERLTPLTKEPGASIRIESERLNLALSDIWDSGLTAQAERMALF